MANYSRIDRISEEVKKELSMVLRDLKDPRLDGRMVSVVSVRVTKDLKFAKANISVFGDKEAKTEVMAAIKSASGFIRKEIGHRLNLRNTPEFTFAEDDGIEYGAHITQILKDLN